MKLAGKPRERNDKFPLLCFETFIFFIFVLLFYGLEERLVILCVIGIDLPVWC